MALTRITSGGIAEGVVIKFDSNNTPTSPAIGFEGANNTGTGIYSPADKEIAFATDGEERLRIKSDGSIVDKNGAFIGGTNPNFDDPNIKNVVMYVSQSDRNASDADTNNGGNINRPFKTIERALLEAARKSFISGNNNDRFEAYTIMVLPGEYVVDNRPGYDVVTNPLAFTNDTTTVDAQPYRFNPRNGGIIVPRGTSIVGYDLRKTVIRPKYVPMPRMTNDLYDEGSITADGYILSNLLYDAANMIEKARGFIQEQTILFLNAEFPDLYNTLTATQRELCKRDVGYFLDALIADLREGGNSNSFIVGEFYVNGGGSTVYNFLDKILNVDEVGPTKESFRFAAELAIKAIHAFDPNSSASISIFKWTDNVTSTNQTVSASTFGTSFGSSYAYGGSSNVATNRGIGTSNGTLTLTSSISRPTYTAGVDYSVGVDSTNSFNSSACASVDTAILNLLGVVTTILENPDDYADSVNKVPGVAHQTAIFKVTGGCYFWQMTFKDALVTDPLNPGNAVANTIPSVSYASDGKPTYGSSVVPNYSHHRVVAFTYADQRTGDGELDRYYRRIDAWAGNTREVRVEEYEIVGDSTTKTTIDTVNSCSPYIFNCSLRSVYGLCGMHTDGSKVKENSFKSMVVAQFTGISLQRDPDAYWQPRNRTGRVYTDGTSFATGDTVRNIESTTPDQETASDRGPIYADSDAEYKHDWRHFHIKASNSAFIQVVSVFAVGYADQFLAVNGGDMSITNSNSNFGQISLRAAGNKFKADPPSTKGKITALIPPAGIVDLAQQIEVYPIDTEKTWFSNLGNYEDTTKQKTNWTNALSKFSTAGLDRFKLFVSVPGLDKESDIPELVIESIDINTNKKIIKRFLTFGSSNNYVLFRDYFQESGALPRTQCTISCSDETTLWTALIDTQNNEVFYTNPTTGERVIGTPGPNDIRNERIGYTWDASQSGVYLKIDQGTTTDVGEVFTQTRSFVSNFLFKTTTEVSFVTETQTDPDTGTETVVSFTENIEVLQYWENFPGSVTSSKLVDDRVSTPSDLIWRVKYLIPKDCVGTPKPPEKRFIIKGTNPTNDERGIPYTSYAFTIWDVEEVDTWERDVRDGVYYLTVLRCDIDKFLDGSPSDTGFQNQSISIIRDDAYQTINSDSLSELNRNDSNYRVTSNVNYLYPSTNEEGNLLEPRVIWNPPLADSRVIVEKVGGGYRPKDVSIINQKYYNSTSSTTPFYDVPSMTSITAEAVNRLVHALDLCYVASSTLTKTRIKVAPTVDWDSRTGNSYGYYPISSTFDIYGSSYRYGDSTNSNAIGNINTYGIQSDPEKRQIICVSGTATTTTFATNTNNNSSTIYTHSPTVPLYRPSILRASSHTWEYIGIGPGNYSTGFPNLQVRVLKAYEQFIAQGYENSGGFVASSGTNSAGDFYIGNQVIQAGGQSSTTLNVPKVRKSSESNSVDFSDIENRIANNVINVISSPNRSSAQQNLLKGLSNFFTTSRLSVSVKANINNLTIGDRFVISRSEISNGEKFPEGGPEGFGFVKGARPEKTGTIAVDTNDRLYVSPKFLDAWRQKKKLLSATNINLDNNRMYIEPLSRTLTNSLEGDTSSSMTFRSPITFTGTIGTVTTNNTTGLKESTVSSVTFTGIYASSNLNYSISANLYVGMKIALVDTSLEKITGECQIKSIDSASQFTITAPDLIATNGLSLYAIDRLTLLDTSGIPPFGRVDIEMVLQGVESQDHILVSGTKYYLNPYINISLQFDEIDYTNNTISLSSVQNYASYKTYVDSVLPSTSIVEKGKKQLHTIIKNYPSIHVEGVIDKDTEITNVSKYLQGTFTAPSGSSLSAHYIGTEDAVTAYDLSKPLTVSSDFWDKLPTRGCVTIRKNPSEYVTFVYYKDSANASDQIYLLRRTIQSRGLTSTTTFDASSCPIIFAGCQTYASYGDKWSVEGAFIPATETITEDVDIESATLYTLPTRPVPHNGKIDFKYTDSIVPNPVTSKALGANLQTKRAVKSFQPFENIKQVADYAQDQGFVSTDVVELLMKPGYYRLSESSNSNYGTTIKFPCVLKINGSGVKETSELYSKEYAKTSAGRIGGYALTSVKSGDSVSFYRSPKFRNNWNGRTDLLYVNNINDSITTTGGLDLSNVHFLGLNESITRNEILDNSYSDDADTVNARRRVRKAWYVKQAKGFPASEAGLKGALAFRCDYKEDNVAASAGRLTFTYYLSNSEITNSSGVTNSVNVASENVTDLTDDKYRAKDARYIEITLRSDDFSSTEDLRQRFKWMNSYVIPGTTLYYFPNSTTGTWTSTTKKTRVLDVNKVQNSSGEVTQINIICALYDPIDSKTNSDEDMDLIYTDVNGVSTEITTLQNGIYCAFVNRDGDEFVTLTYNWCLERRRSFLPKNFTFSAQGYDTDIYDEPEIFGIISGYAKDTINLVIDSNPSADFGPIKSINREGTAPTTNSTSAVVISSGFTATKSDGVTASEGTEAQFLVSWTGGVYTVTIQNVGSNYAINDIITIPGNHVSINGASGTNDLKITIRTVTATKKSYPGISYWNYHPSITLKYGTSNTEEGSVVIPTYPNGERRLYGRSSNRYYLLEVNAANISSASDNSGVNSSIRSNVGGFGYSDIDFLTGSIIVSGDSVPITITQFNVTTTGTSVTATVSSVAGITTNDKLVVVGATPSGLNGTWSITSVNSGNNTFVFTTGSNITAGTYTGSALGKSVRLPGVVIDKTRLKTTNFSSDDEFLRIAKYNLSQSSGYRINNPTNVLYTRGRKVFVNYAQNYRVNRKKFPTSTPPSVGNLGATLIKVNGIPGTNCEVKLTDVTIGALSDSEDRSNTYGGAYWGGIISIANGQVNLRGVRFRGNLSLDWSGLLTDGGARLSSKNKFAYGHSVDLIEPSGSMQINGLGNNRYSQLNVSKNDILFKYYTMFSSVNNLFIEPNYTATGERVDYDSRTFPITTIASISKYNALNQFNTNVVLNEKFLTDKIVTTETTTGSAAGFELRWNNSNVTLADSTTIDAHPDGNSTMPPKTLAFKLPYISTSQKTYADTVAKNIYPNYTKIIRNGNSDSVLATVIDFQFYQSSGVAYFEVTFSGNVTYSDYSNYNTTATSLLDDFELQLLTNYIPSQRFNYVGTLTTRYKKVSNATNEYDQTTKYSRYEVAYDDAQKKSKFALHKDIKIRKLGSGTPSGVTFPINRTSGSNLNYVYFTNPKNPTATNDEKLKVLMETDSTGNIISLDIVSLGINNVQSDKLYYPYTSSSVEQEQNNTYNGYVIQMNESTKARLTASDLDYEMFEPGEITALVANNTFIVNNFIESNLTGIKSTLQKCKSIITPGNYIKYGSQYYKIAQSSPGKPYLSVYQYANPDNTNDIRASLVIRLEEETYDIGYNSSLRFDLYEDDNLLRYWPDSGRLIIGELELADFTKQYKGFNTGYELTIIRSNTKYWPSYIHDWDGIEILETFGAGTADVPAEAPPSVSVNSVNATSLRLADPIDTTSSTYKRIARIGTITVPTYITKTGVVTTERSFIDVVSSGTLSGSKLLDENKYEIGQVITIPFRNLKYGRNKQGSSSRFDTWPDHMLVTVIDAEGVAGEASSSNRAGDNLISVEITNLKEATADFETQTDLTSGVILLPISTGNPHQIVNINNTPSSGLYAHEIYNFVDPLSIVTSQKSFSSMLGKPTLTTASVTIVSGSLNEFTVFESGTGNHGANCGRGIVPGLTVTHSDLPDGEALISSVSRSGSSGSYTYNIILNKSFASSGTKNITFTNRIKTKLVIDAPLLQNIASSTTFKIVTAFNSEGHGWCRHTSVYSSRITDIKTINESANARYIRLTLSDPLSFGLNNEFTLASADCRHFGFCSINHGGWSYPRSGGSYIPSNIPVVYPIGDYKIGLPNSSGRIQAGDTFKYTYEATSVVQEISTSTTSLTSYDRIRFSSPTVAEGDSLKSLLGSDRDAYFGVPDRFKDAGTYTVTHRRYVDKTGKQVDNYTFGNSSATSSFYNGTSISTVSPTTSYIKDGVTYYVDIGASNPQAGDSAALATTDFVSTNTSFGVYRIVSGDVAEQNTSDVWRSSIVTSNSGSVGKDAIFDFTVTSIGAIDELTITNGGTGYKENDWIIIKGAVFNKNNPRYPKDLVLYVSAVNSSTGEILSVIPRFELTNVQNSSDSFFVSYVFTAIGNASETAGKLVKYTTREPVSASGATITSGNYYLIIRPGTTTWSTFGGPTGSDLKPGVAFKATSSGTASGTGRFVEFAILDDGVIFIDTISGGDIYLKAKEVSTTGDINEYSVRYIGGFTAGQKIVFTAAKPTLKTVTGTIVAVGSANATTGYSDCSISSPDNILYSGADATDWLSVSDILVSHASDLFAYDGPVCKRIFHCEYGGNIGVDEFSIWNTWYQNNSANKGYGIYGSPGWVGNFGRSVNGEKPIGLTSTGSLTVNWNRQRGNSIWMVAQPVRPAWTHRGQTTDTVLNGQAFAPAFRYFHTNGTLGFFTTSIPQYLMEDNQFLTAMAAPSVKKHVSIDTDSIKVSVGTSEEHLRNDWWAGYYHEGGIGPLSYGVYNWSNTFDSSSTARIKNKNKITYALRDLTFRKSSRQWGDINWGTGGNIKLSEQMVLNYVQNYTTSVYSTSIFRNTNLTVSCTSGQSTVTTSNSNNNARRGRVLTSASSFVVGKQYIVKAVGTGLDWTLVGANKTTPNVGDLFVATRTTFGGTNTEAYEVDSKIARGDALYALDGTEYKFLGFARFVSGGSGQNDVSTITLTAPTAHTISAKTLYIIRVAGLKTEEYSNAVSNDNNTTFRSGDNVVSADSAASTDYNISMVIGKRSYNTTPILNTANQVQPIGNYWWYFGANHAYKQVTATFGDLSAFDYTPFNINMTRFNSKVHLEAAVTITCSPSTIGLTNIYI